MPPNQIYNLTLESSMDTVGGPSGMQPQDLRWLPHLLPNKRYIFRRSNQNVMLLLLPWVLYICPMGNAPSRRESHHPDGKRTTPDGKRTIPDGKRTIPTRNAPSRRETHFPDGKRTSRRETHQFRYESKNKHILTDSAH